MNPAAITARGDEQAPDVRSHLPPLTIATRGTDPIMPQSDEQMPTPGLDRMDHPLSHLSAVVGAVAFIVCFGAVVMWLSNARMVYSSKWWVVTLACGFVLATSVIAYFRPYSQAIYVPIALAGLVAIGYGVFSVVSALRSPDAGTLTVRLIQSSIAVVGWLLWAVRVVWLLREGRRQQQAETDRQFRLR